MLHARFLFAREDGGAESVQRQESGAGLSSEPGAVVNFLHTDKQSCTVFSGSAEPHRCRTDHMHSQATDRLQPAVHGLPQISSMALTIFVFRHTSQFDLLDM